MRLYFGFVLITLCCLASLASQSQGDDAKTLLAEPARAYANITSSPKFDDRLFVYSAEPISASIVEQNADGQELALDVGATEGVRFGQAFQIVEPTSQKWVGVAKIMELDSEHCVARLISLNKEATARSLKGYKAVCIQPKAKKADTVIECRWGKDVWQTESFENKLIRGLLENCGKNVQIRVRQEINNLSQEDEVERNE
jgi:hypothetical protein